MKIKQTVDDILIDGKYKKTRDRVCKFIGNYNLSDKDIIEHLVKEINQYRNTIQLQQEKIKELKEKKIQDEDTKNKEKDDIKESKVGIDCLEAIYKAEIFEYESGRIDIVYECDKENNNECSKESCMKYNYCNHTLNKKYAKNYKQEI